MRKKLMVILFLSVLLIDDVVSDTYIVQKVHTDAYSIAGAHIPAKDERSIIWSAGDKIRLNSTRDTSMIVRLDKELLYIIYKRSKRVTILDFNEVQKQLGDLASELNSAGMASGVPLAFVSIMKFDASVNPDTEIKKIGKWKCTKYNITSSLPMGSAAAVLWATTDINLEYFNLTKMLKKSVSQTPKITKILNEYNKIKGFPVVTTYSLNIMGTEIMTKEELVEVSQKRAPAGIYEVPSTYSIGNME